MERRVLGWFFFFFWSKDLKRTKALPTSEITECSNIMDLHPQRSSHDASLAGSSCSCVGFSDASACPHGVTMKLCEGRASSQIPSVQSWVPPIAKIIIWLLVSEPSEYNKQVFGCLLQAVYPLCLAGPHAYYCHCFGCTLSPFWQVLL